MAWPARCRVFVLLLSPLRQRLFRSPLSGSQINLEPASAVMAHIRDSERLATAP